MAETKLKTNIFLGIYLVVGFDIPECLFDYTAVTYGIAEWCSKFLDSLYTERKKAIV